MSSLPKKNDDGQSLVSYTQMNKYKMCPKAYEYRYVEGIKAPMPGRVLVGSAFDKAITLINERLADQKTVATDEAKTLASDYLTNPDEEYDTTDIAGMDDLPDKIISTVDEYATLVAPTLQVVDAQREINYALKDDVIFNGYIDLVEMTEAGLTITDIKTTLKKRSGKYTHETASTDDQLTLYAATMLGEQASGRGWRVADIGRKTAGRIETIHVKDNKQQQTNENAINGALAIVNQMEAACDTGLFPPYGKGTWLCSFSYCEFYNRCEYGSRAQTSIPVGGF